MVVEPTQVEKYTRQISFPKDRDENKKHLKPPPNAAYS